MHFSLKALGWITTTLLLCIAVPTAEKMAPLGISGAVAQETIPNPIEDANRLSEEGKAQLYRGEYAAAREKFQWVLEIYREAGDRLSEAYTLNDLGTVDRYLGQYSSALELHQQALLIFQEINSRTFDPQKNKGEIECLHHLGMTYQGLGRYSEAVEAFQQALTWKEERGNIASSRRYLRRGKLDWNGLDTSFESYPQAIEFYRQELATAENLDTDSSAQQFQQLHRQVIALKNLGVAYQDIWHFQEWIDTTRQEIALAYQMLQLAREMRNRENEAIALMHLGDIHRYSLQQEQPALETYQQALEIYKDLGNLVGEAQVSLQIIDIKTDYNPIYNNTVFSQSQLALEMSQKVLEIYQQLGDRSGEAAAWLDIGDAYLSLSRLQPDRSDSLRQQAIEAYEQALMISREENIRKPTIEIDALLKLRWVYYDLKNHQKEIEFIQKGLEIAREIGDRWREAIATDILANLYQRSDRFQEANELYLQGLNVSRYLGYMNFKFWSLDGLVETYLLLGQSQEAIEMSQQQLTLFQETNQGVRLGMYHRKISQLGKLYKELGQYQQAFELYQTNLERMRTWGNFLHRYLTVQGLSKIYNFLEYHRGNVELYQQELRIAREQGDESWEIRALTDLGLAYRELGEYSQAIEIYQKLLEQVRNQEDWDDEIRIVNTLARTYQKAGQRQRAIDVFQEALNLDRDRRDIVFQATHWYSFGQVYEELDLFQEAITAYQKAFELFQDVKNSLWQVPIRINALENMGKIYRSLGQFKQALEVYQKRQTLFQEENPTKSFLAYTSLDISFVYHALGQEQRSTELIQEALFVATREGNRSLLTLIAAHLEELGQVDRAIEVYQEALVTNPETNSIVRGLDSKVEIFKSLAQLYQNRGETQQAISYYEQALTVTRQLGSRNEEGLVLQKIAELFGKQNQPELSILFYKQAVNVWEAIRQDFQELPPELEQAYVNTVADSYRALADLLLQNDRILEAQQVLDLLKVQELDTYLKHVRGNEQTAQGVEYLPSELEILELYNQAITQGRELEELRTVPPAEMTPEQQQRLEELSRNEREIRSVFNEFIDNPEVVAAIENLSRTAQRQNLDLESLNSLQDNLQNLQQNAVLLYPLILENRLELVLVTPYSPPIRRTVPVKRAELNRAITTFRQALESPGSDAKTPANQLYTWLIQPIENDLEAANAETLIYAPDAQLRYVPLAALHDGNGWLTERFRINHITAASLTDFNLQPPSDLRVIAGAFSQGNYSIQLGDRSFNFSGLPFARVEVENLERDIPETTTLFDTHFSPDAMVPQMDSHTIVHLATHAAFLTGEPENSFILFGNGDRVTLNEIRTWTFRNVDLFVLSACETGVGGQLGDGTEILGFGYLMQQAGAASAIASLWAVDDGGTQALMNAFYGALQEGNTTKAEALRQAQLALITGDYSAVGDSRGDAIELVFTQSLPLPVEQRLTHPYYWAPFILIGNGL